MKTVRRIFFTGMVIMLPVLITIHVLVFTFNVVDSILGSILNLYLGFSIPGLGFLITLLLIFGVGLVATNVFGHKLIKFLEELILHVPLVKPIYAAVRQIVNTFAAQKRRIFESVVMIEYPRKGIYALAFVTGEASGEVQHKTKAKTISVFLPTTPNPTSGFLLLVPSEEVIPMDMGVEEALKLIISGGAVTPDWKPST